MRKKAGIALIVFAVLFVGASIYMNINSTKENDKNSDSTTTSQNEITGILDDESINNKDQNEGKNNQEENEITFDNLESPIKYILNDEIKSRLNPKEFDKAFLNFIKKKKLAPSIDYLEVKDDGFITIDLNQNVLMFDLQLQIKGRPIVSVAVTNNGEYAFDVL